ncbi:exonuclease SbcC [Clostridium saccharoperbutylacetonicum]|uniref:Nuclease SbcCD subunit C n=1 Tax=Clostridium saccharoperbutylacetonicum N1-4(HMT) TaxID=931276 RepID=M1MTE7_9CLOT|nr:AAA family ATPase [Clostridium saccharoperbutylacetonicum]AGF54837.1 nuclease SbcCD subunit C [Clostridium saccharoperbutylacetonicum N1-4(HMT)]NRT64458.1 exonuclease SbcC [Clostridium saccharoperbutylacetonicum]NSB27829.1 exonuclease SbcC [Clostridium saccharoperbutylacetonicum]NSB41314.1 exonuclease SbcC [Clostridium saccharoperbutylacetonicum]
MRPVRLKIRGLNSFIDEQTIDFDKLTDRGFFGIFGPTGSGKSTILDGITLALYGNLARKSSNFINTNCDRLNVNFEFQISGSETRKYIIDREFRRKKDGSINSGKCKIVDITDSEEVLADSVKNMNKKVEEIIGLNLEDFTRTVVLPQGKFSEFLKLEGKDRRDMLERLFNLEQFGDNLTRKLNTKISKERTENSVLIGQLSVYSDISDEKLKEKQAELQLTILNLENLKKELDNIEKNYKENEELWKLQLELLEYKNKEKLLKEKEEEINKDIEKIRLGEAGEKVIPYIKAYENTKKEFTKNEVEFQDLKVKIEKIKEEQENIEKSWNEIKDKKENKLPQLMIQEEKIKNAIEEKKLLEKILAEINMLMTHIEEVKIKLEKGQKDLIEIENEIKIKDKEIKEDEKRYDEIKIDELIKEKVQEGILCEEKISSLKNNISKDTEKKAKIEKENDDIIASGKALKETIEEATKELEEKLNQHEYLLNNPPGEQKDLLNLKQVILENEQNWSNFNKFTNEIAASKKEIVKLNTEIEKIQMEEAKNNQELEELKAKEKEIMTENIAHTLRMELKDGEACPVCGAIHHIKENIKVLSATDISLIENKIKEKEEFIKVVNNNIIENQTKVITLNEKISNNESEIINIGSEFKEKTLEKLQEEFINLEKALENYNKDKEGLDKIINELKNNINIKNGEINELRAVVRTNMKQLKELEENIKVNTQEFNELNNNVNLLKSETLITNFIEKNEEIKAVEKERERLAKKIKENRVAIENLENRKEKLNNEVISIKELLVKYNADLAAYEKNRDEKLLAIRSKVSEESNLDNMLSEVQENIKNINEEFFSAQKNKDRIQKEFTDNNEKLIDVGSKYKELIKRKKDEEAQLEVSIDSEGFKSLEEVKANLIEKEEINKYKEKIDDYRENLSKVKGTIESLLNKIDGKTLNEEDYTKVKLLKEQKEIEFSSVNENKIKVDEELKKIKIKLNEQRELFEKKNKLEHKLALLGDLEKLFKGKKFVEFVAINKLKYISIEASKRLREITHGNYGLEVDENGKFMIRDYKNGGAERDSSTLSGGETFIASLSLALALSAQIQLKGTAPLELFFLDEGFGTLDDELLEVVMGSLERIHNEKLKVGIISHVEAIKNRVPIKLMITPAECGMGGSKVRIERS